MCGTIFSSKGRMKNVASTGIEYKARWEDLAQRKETNWLGSCALDISEFQRLFRVLQSEFLPFGLNQLTKQRDGHIFIWYAFVSA